MPIVDRGDVQLQHPDQQVPLLQSRESPPGKQVKHQDVYGRGDRTGNAVLDELDDRTGFLAEEL